MDNFSYTLKDSAIFVVWNVKLIIYSVHTFHYQGCDNNVLIYQVICNTYSDWIHPRQTVSFGISLLNLDVLLPGKYDLRALQ